MAGSLNHIVHPESGEFYMDSIDNLRDARQTLEECFNLIAVLTGGKMDDVNKYLDSLNYPRIKHNMIVDEGLEDFLKINPDIQTTKDEPYAWMRSWFFNKEEPKKERNEKGRMVWPLKFKFLPVTEHRIFHDDIPLFRGR